MILLQKGAINTVVLTLTEKTSVSPVYYLFQLESEQTKIKTLFLASDTSSHLTRYNEFQIEETDTPDVMNGKISLIPGFYEYRVYQQTSPTNLDPELSRGQVEIGKVKVIQEATINAYDEQEKTIPAYNG